MKKILAIAVATAISAPAMADLTIGANIETNTNFGDTSDFDQSESRVQLSVAGGTTAADGSFVSAQANINSGIGAGTVTTDGVSLTIGNTAGSINLGGREAEIWANGGDIIATNASTTVVGYTGTAQRAHNAQNVVVSLNVAEGTTVQALVRPDGNGDYDSRLTVTTAVGGLALGAALESDAAADASAEGFVVNASTTVSDVALGLSYAKAEDDDSSVAVYGTLSGLNLGYQSNEEAAGTKSNVAFVAYPMADVMGVSGLTVTLGASTSTADGAADVTNGNVRVNYAF